MIILVLLCILILTLTLTCNVMNTYINTIMYHYIWIIYVNM